MKIFQETTYKLYRKTPLFSGQSKSLKIAVISDIHFSRLVKTLKLRAIIKQFELARPDYIFITGDLVDTLECVDSLGERERFLSFLKNLTAISSVRKMIVSLGNHDFYRTSEDKKGWLIVRDKEFLKSLREVPNLVLLDDEVYQDDDIFCFGYTQKKSYYTEDGVNFAENAEAQLEDLTKTLANLPEPPADKLKFALIHAPTHLQTPDIEFLLQPFDYILSGHMHNGIVPPVLDEFWLSQKGIISPTKKLFSGACRHTLETYDDKLIVVGPVTTFHAHLGLLEKLNVFYPTYLTYLEISDKKTYARKPYVKHTYKNWQRQWGSNLRP